MFVFYRRQNTLAPSKHPTPCEGKERGGIIAPFLPGRRQIEQFFPRGHAVARNGGMQLSIPAFRHSIRGERPDPICRPIADVVGERFDAAEPRCLKKAAQPPTRIRLGDPCRPPQLLSDIVETPWTGAWLSGEDDTIVFHGRRADHAAASGDAPKLRDDFRRIRKRFQDRMTKDCVERRVVKRQRSSIGVDPTEVLLSEQEASAPGALKADRIEIDADNASLRECLGEAHGDGPGAAAAIKHDRPGTEVRYKKARIDFRTPQLYRSPYLFCRPRLCHLRPGRRADTLSR